MRSCWPESPFAVILNLIQDDILNQGRHFEAKMIFQTQDDARFRKI